MKRLLVLAALSLAALAETAAQAPAWWPGQGWCHSGCQSNCNIHVSCRPYNAFSPTCSVNVRGDLNCLAGCGGRPWGGRAGCNRPYGAGACGQYPQGCGVGYDECGGCDSCGGCGNSMAGIQPFCPVIPMPFAAPASVAAACGGQRAAGKCGFLGRLGRRFAVEQAPNGCNPGFTAECGSCDNGPEGRHLRHRRESWWARFSRQQLCCPADSCGVMEYTCGGCNNDCGGCNTAPTTAPVRPVAPPKPLPQKRSQASISQDAGGLSVLQEPIGQN